jgi:hypothetical protein
MLHNYFVVQKKIASEKGSAIKLLDSTSAATADQKEALPTLW